MIVSALYPRDSRHEPSLVWLEAHLLTDGGLTAPTLLLGEVAGAIARQTGDPALGQRAASFILNLPDMVLVDLDRRRAQLTAEIAANLRLRGADATYVAVAVDLNLPLVSWDREQIERGAQRIITRRPDDSSNPDEGA